MAQTETTNRRDDRYGGEAGRRFQEHSVDWVQGDDGPRDDDAQPVDEIVERLRRETSAAVGRAPADERVDVREYVSELLREDTPESSALPRQRPTRRAGLSFVAVAGWLVLAGALLAFLSPPAGIVCVLMAGVAAVLGALLGPREIAPERTSGPDAA